MSNNNQHRMEVILEDINGKFDLVLEGHGALRKEFRDTRDYLNDKIELNTSLIKTAHDSLDGKIDGVQTTLAEKIDGVQTTLAEKIDGVETTLTERIDTVGNEIVKTRRELKTEIRDIGGKVDGHETRIQYLEHKAA